MNDEHSSDMRGREERFKPSKDGRTIDDDDFKYDAALKITGDFGSDEQRRRYAQWLCDKLNAPDEPRDHLATPEGVSKPQLQSVSWWLAQLRKFHPFAKVHLYPELGKEFVPHYLHYPGDGNDGADIRHVYVKLEEREKPAPPSEELLKLAEEVLKERGIPPELADRVRPSSLRPRLNLGGNSEG